MDTSINSGDDYDNSLADLNRDQVFDVDQSYDADPDFAYEDEQQHLGEQSTVHGSTSIDTFPSTLDAEMFPETIPDSELSQEELARRQKSNAKAVECLDLDGNLIKLYKSGMAASQELNIPQGDISLCCRGLKLSHMGYRFRFYGDKQIKFETTKLKRGFVVEPIIEKIENTRTTRASRGEYGSNRETKSSIFPPSDIKSRTWTQEFTKAGHLTIKKWKPTIDEPNEELQKFLPKQKDLKIGNRKPRPSVAGRKL